MGFIFTNLIAVALLLMASAAQAISYTYTYGPQSLIVQPMLDNATDTPSDCVLINDTLVAGTTGPHARVLYCRNNEDQYNEGVFGIHGFVPVGTTLFDIVVDVYSESASSGNLCAVVNNTVIAQWSFADSGVTQGVRYDSGADDSFVSGLSAVLGPVAVSGSKRRVKLSANNVQLVYIGNDGTRQYCDSGICNEQYFRIEVYIQGCQRLCTFVSPQFSCCGGGTCSNIGKVKVLGVTLNFHD
jgi:hypothetical protein